MKQGIFRIAYNRLLAKNTYEMKLLGDTSAITAPGQFVNIKLEGFYLRRPISVCDYDENSIHIIYKVVGKGTKHMSALAEGETLDLLTGLGNGYDLSKSGNRPLLIGGGAGIPPLYRLAKDLAGQGKTVVAVLGFNTAEEVFYKNEFEMIGTKVYITTVDDSVGIKGFVTDAMDNVDYTYFYACGPEPMLRAVYDKSVSSGQISFEEKMGCGFGACVGCTCKTKYGNKRICKDGPVLLKEEIIW